MAKKPTGSKHTVAATAASGRPPLPSEPAPVAATTSGSSAPNHGASPRRVAPESPSPESTSSENPLPPPPLPEQAPATTAPAMQPPEATVPATPPPAGSIAGAEATSERTPKAAQAKPSARGSTPSASPAPQTARPRPTRDPEETSKDRPMPEPEPTKAPASLHEPAAESEPEARANPCARDDTGAGPCACARAPEPLHRPHHARAGLGRQGRRAGRRGLRSESRAGDPRQSCRDHPADVRDPAARPDLRDARGLQGSLGPLVRRRHPLHGLLRLRARAQVLLHRAALAGQLLQPRQHLRLQGRRPALRLLLACGDGVPVEGGQASGRHPLPRLADRPGPGLPVRDLSAARDDPSAGLSHHPQLRPSGRHRRGDPARHRPAPAGALLPLRPNARQSPSQGTEPAQGRHRLFQLRHHRLAALCLRDQGPGPGLRSGADPAHPSDEVRRRGQRHRLRHLESGGRPVRSRCATAWRASTASTTTSAPCATA